MKKPVRILLITASLLAVLLLGAAVLSRAVYGRSLRATVYEQLLRRRYANPRTVQEETDRLEARRRAGETPYALPASLELKSEVVETRARGMQLFTLNGGGDPLVIYLHGGAYVNAFNAYQWRFMDRLAREAGCAVLAPAYHLAPFGDCVRGVADLAGLWGDLCAEYPGRRLVLMGDSAGGGLALALAQRLVQEGGALPERLILYSPWADVSMDNPEILGCIPADPILNYDLVRLHGQYWAGDCGTHDPLASPLYGDMAGLPPVTLYFGSRELLYPDLLLLTNALEAAGTQVDAHIGRGLNHDFPLMPIPEADRAFRQVAALVKGG